MSNQLTHFLFESNQSNSWVDVLEDSAMVKGKIVSQDAGSTSKGIYYQIGGKNLNALFGAALSKTGQLQNFNDALQYLYDQSYGKDMWQKDSQSGRTDALTSFLLKLQTDGQYIGTNIEAMIYSVGPVLGVNGIVDHAQYQAVYTDAIDAVDEWVQQGNPVAGMRITMLSCGIYGRTVNDKNKLYLDAATDIICGIAKGLANSSKLAPFTILINTNDKKPQPNERSAFTAAATNLGLTVSKSGFSFDPAQLVTQLSKNSNS